MGMGGWWKSGKGYRGGGGWGRCMGEQSLWQPFHNSWSVMPALHVMTDGVDGLWAVVVTRGGIWERVDPRSVAGFAAPLLC